MRMIYLEPEWEEGVSEDNLPGLESVWEGGC